MAFHYPVHFAAARLERPLAALVGRSERNPIAPRDHVEAASHHDVVELGLGEKHRELTFDGRQGLVAEEIAGAEPAAIHDDWLIEGKDLIEILERAEHDVATGNAVVPQERTHVGSELLQ